MPLDRAHITVASRVMLPVYPIFSALFGLGLLLTPRDRMLQTPVFQTADHVAPLPTWGVLFLVVAALQVSAMVAKTRPRYTLALGLLIVLMGVWTVVFIASALHDQAPWTSPLWPG